MPVLYNLYKLVSSSNDWVMREMNNEYTCFLIDNTFIFDFSDSRLTDVTSGASTRLLTPSSHCLRYLITHKGNIVSRPTLMEQGWEQFGFVVSTNTLNQNILLIRKAISQFSDKEIIKTVFRQGVVIPENITIRSFYSLDDLQLATQQNASVPVNRVAKSAAENMDAVIASGAFLKQAKNAITRIKQTVKTKELLYPLSLFLIFTLPASYLYHFIEPGASDTIHHLPISNSYSVTAGYKACSIFSRSEDIDLQAVENQLNKFQISCDTTNPAVIYYDNYPVINRESFIVCSKGLSGAFTECHSFYLLT